MFRSDRFRKYLGCFMAFVLVTVLIQSALASQKSISEMQEERDKIQQSQQATSDKLEETKEEKVGVVSDIEKLDRQIIEIEDALLITNDRLDKTTAELDKTTQELEAAIEKRESQYEALKKRVVFMYENGEMGYLEVILSSDNFGDMLNRTEYIKEIMDYDKNLLSSLIETEDTITEKKEQIENQKLDLELLRDEQKTQQDSLETARQSKLDLLDNISQQEEQYENEIERLEREDRELAELIKKAQQEAERKAAAARAAAANRSSSSSSSSSSNTQKYTGSGDLAWPAPSYICVTSGFVRRTNPVTGKQELHTGVDLASAYGTDVVAADSGVVQMSKWYGGYGECVIINHGNGMTTLYGHNSKRLVSEGDYVTRGQVIAKCGSTGQSTGNHVHFEVRINGTAVDPMPYIQ